jgi:hypothetical protein
MARFERRGFGESGVSDEENEDLPLYEPEDG